MSESGPENPDQAKVVPDHRKFAALSDAAVFLDANLPDRRDWFSAVGKQAMFRIPGFKANWDLLLPRTDNPRDQRKFRGDFHRKAEELALHFSQTRGNWCEASFNMGQINAALSGEAGGLLRFDKAIVLACAMNEFVTEAKLPRERLIGAHEIAACVFYFAGLADLIAQAASTERAREYKQAFDADTSATVRRMIVRSSAQPEYVIGTLAGNQPASSSFGDRDKAATHTASYRTQRAILKALTVFLPGIDNQGERENQITRKSERGAAKKAVRDEAIGSTQRITRPPYGWPKDTNFDWPEYPPDVKT